MALCFAYHCLSLLVTALRCVAVALPLLAVPCVALPCPPHLTLSAVFHPLIHTDSWYLSFYINNFGGLL
ncbi:MAG: hypothetical protein RR827_08915 [Oscillospiraceae bacterium]